MPTRTVATFAGGLITYQADYDASNRVTALRCINNGDHAVAGSIVQESNGRTRGGTYQVGTSTTTIPTTTSQRIVVSVDATRNRLLGVRWTFEG